MSETKIYPPPPGFAARALINASKYASMYRESITDTEAFWAKQARERLTWTKPFTQVKDTSFDAVRTDFMQFGVGLQIQM